MFSEAIHEALIDHCLKKTKLKEIYFCDINTKVIKVVIKIFHQSQLFSPRTESSAIGQRQIGNSSLLQ